MSEPQAPPARPTSTVPAHAIIPEKLRERFNDERRKEPRYPAKHDQANVGWYRGESYQTVPGRLEDVSSSGASLVLDDGASWEGGDVWLCLSGGVRTEWVRGEVAGVSQVEGSAQRVRLRFHESCPFDFFKTVAWGGPKAPAPRGDVPGAPRTEQAQGSPGPHFACTADDETPTLEDDFRALRVSVTMYQAPRAPEKFQFGRLREDERDDRVLLVPKAYLAVLQIVGATLVAGVILVKLLQVWQLDVALGLAQH